MNTFQKSGTTLALAGAITACSPAASVLVEGDISNPTSVTINFNSSPNVYAKCVHNVLDAKGYGTSTNSTQTTIKVPVPNCTLETIQKTLRNYGLDNEANEVPVIKN